MTVQSIAAAQVDPWGRIVAFLESKDPLYTEAERRRAAGETPPRDAVLLLNTSELHPNEIVRRKDLRRFIGLADSATDELIKCGELTPFTLQPNGIATGVTGASLLAFQLRGILRRAFALESGKADLDKKAADMRARKAEKAVRA
jgi:hypothetical protein